jgi:hypothetical protein
MYKCTKNYPNLVWTFFIIILQLQANDSYFNGNSYDLVHRLRQMGQHFKISRKEY